MLRALVASASHSLYGFALGGFILIGSASAQIRTDGSFGPARNLIGPSFAIGADLGRQLDHNLFHSFSTFNVGQGETAKFTGPSSISNVIARVTGGSASNVNGQIASTIPKADLFLINPAGWVFGRTATLNVQGSVHVSTADVVRFADGTVMSTASPGSSSLTVAPPTAFGFLGMNPGGISINGSALAPGAGKDLSLVGGPVSIKNAAVEATAGKVRIVSTAGPGDVSLQHGSRSGASAKAFGPVTISGTSIRVFNASGGQARGGLRVKGGTVTIANGSTLIAGNSTSASYPTVSVRGDDVALTGSQLGSAAVGSGNGGAIQVKANRSVSIGPDQAGNSSILSGASAASATSGSVSIASGDTILVQPGSKIGSGTFNGLAPGQINLQAPHISINGPDTGVLSSTGTDSSANAGPISLTADTITVANGGIIATAALGKGNSGTITISTHLLTLNNQGEINTNTFGLGNAGDISISGIGQGSQVVIDGSNPAGRTGIFSEPQQTAAGNGGHISVLADSIALQGGQISSTSFGSKSAGSVDVTAKELYINGLGRTAGAGGLFSNAEPSNSTTTGAETAGPVTVTAHTIGLSNGGEITSSTFGNGNGGPVNVTANDITIRGPRSGIFSSAGSGADNDIHTGSGGQVTVRAGQVAVTQGGLISSSSSDAGRGGDISLSGGAQPLDLLVSGTGSSVQALASSGRSSGAGMIAIAGNTITVADQGNISTTAEAGGGGEIGLGAGRLLRLDRGSIATSVRGGSGNGGDVLVNGRFVVLDHSRIQANADAGRGGNINITAQTYLASPDSEVQASAARGINGTITIQAPQSDVAGTLAELSGSLLRPPALQQQGCSVLAKSQGVSSFVVGAGSALPRNGDGPQAAPYFDIREDATPRAGNQPVTPTALLPAAMRDVARSCRR
jgi:filamentous hemagglutinin family protein